DSLIFACRLSCSARRQRRRIKNPSRSRLHGIALSSLEKVGSRATHNHVARLVSAFGSLPRRVLYVSGDVVRTTLGLVDLSFGLHFLITRHLADNVLYGALHLASSALHVFAVHVFLLCFGGGW